MQPLVVHVRLMETSYKQAPSSPMRATASFLTTMAPTPICSLLTSELYCVVLDADASFLVAFLDATLTRWSDFFWRILLAYYKSCLISRCWWWWPPSISMGWAFLVWMLEPLSSGSAAFRCGLSLDRRLVRVEHWRDRDLVAVASTAWKLLIPMSSRRASIVADGAGCRVNLRKERERERERERVGDREFRRWGCG